MKKSASFILILLLALGVFAFPSTVYAADPQWTDGLSYNAAYAFGGGSGTSADDPYIIGSTTDLAQLSVNVKGGTDYSGVFFKLTADIDLSGKIWAPIGGFNSPNFYSFNGSLDGNSHTISNMDAEATFYAGLFGFMENGAISNLTVSGIATASNAGASLIAARMKNASIRNCSVSGSVATGSDSYGGGIAGECTGGTVENCTSSAIIVVANSHAGGLIGYCTGTTVTNCSASGDVTGDRYVGGLIGSANNFSHVTGCHANGKVTANTQNAGGLIGSCYSIVSECYATGNASAITFAYAGGLTGTSALSTISKCYATGNAQAPQYAGGFTGVDSPGSTFTNCYARGNATATNNMAGAFAGALVNTSVLKNCYGSGGVTGGTGYLGGFVGNNSATSFTACFFDRTIAGRDAAGINGDTGSSAVTGVTGLTTVNMQGADTLTNASKMDGLDSGEGSGVWYAKAGDYPDFEVVATYTVTFNSQSANTDASPSSKSVVSGSTVDALPTAPVKTAYTFGGWFTQINGGGTQFTASTAVTADITVYAKWTSSASPTEDESDDIPRTNDDTPYWIGWVLLCGAGIAAAGLVVFKKQRQCLK